jgi:hypothetical protein
MLASVSTASNVCSAIFDGWDELYCCRVYSFWQCQATLLSLYQVMLFGTYFKIAVGFICCVILYALVLMFHPTEEESDAKQKKIGSITYVFYAILNIIIAPIIGVALLLRFGSGPVRMLYF